MSRLTLPAVAVGGAVGALARWGAGELVPDGGGFPWTTFAVNVLGCLAIALLPLLTTRPLLVAALGPGVLGGFTTMSAYAEQTRALLADGSTGVALTYLLGTLLACLGAVLLAERLTGDDPTQAVEP